MFEYKNIECKCGQQARIVESAVGTYIRCPYCEAGTYMCSTTEQALVMFKEEGGEEDEM